jgi:hypothetical protein
MHVEGRALTALLEALIRWMLFAFQLQPEFDQAEDGFHGSLF